MASKNAQSGRKGKATEQLLAAMCVLATSGELNALTALVDDEGVDIGFKRRNGSRVLDVQVKARFSDEDGSKSLREKAQFVSDVRIETFRPREDLYMLYAAVNAARAEIEAVWLVPSLVLAERAFQVKTGEKILVRFQASVKEGSEDKWTPFRMAAAGLPLAVLDVVETLEPAPITLEPGSGAN